MEETTLKSGQLRCGAFFLAHASWPRDPSAFKCDVAELSVCAFLAAFTLDGWNQVRKMLP